MKKSVMILLAVGLMSATAMAQDKKEEPTPGAPTGQAQPKMTTKDAKKTCKDEGKTGADLIQCMKDKKEEK